MKEQLINKFNKLGITDMEELHKSKGIKLPSSKPIDISKLSEAELNAELEKGYADIEAGRTKPAKQAFADIHKDYDISSG
jgi:beta-galactosidase beta subunit